MKADETDKSEISEDKLNAMVIDDLLDLMTNWTTDISGMYKRKEGILAIRAKEKELVLIQKIIVTKKAESLRIKNQYEVS